jgi:hypothetical protein
MLMVVCFQREQETVCVEPGQPARHPRPTVRRPAPGPRYGLLIFAGPRYGFIILDICGPSMWSLRTCPVDPAAFMSFMASHGFPS